MIDASTEMRIVVLISGSGSNLQALIDSYRSGALGGKICAVISNRPSVKGLERAAAARIPALTLDHTTFASREQFDQALQTLIDSYDPGLVLLAGFMRILTPAFTAHFRGRLINIHPSLLPRHPGLNTHERALAAGDREHGASVHFVTEELDGGPVILQGSVTVIDGEAASGLAQRVLHQEHRIYPQVAQWFCAGRLELIGNQAFFDGQALGPAGALINPSN
jgi:phosphoribosylglycinamide formyltransferase 1